jgi:hypothetical protein
MSYLLVRSNEALHHFVTSAAQIEAYKLVSGVCTLCLYVPSPHEREFIIYCLFVSSHPLKMSYLLVRSNEAYLQTPCEVTT